MRYYDAMNIVASYVNVSEFYLVNPKYFRDKYSSMIDFRNYIKSFLYKGVSFHISSYTHGESRSAALGVIIEYKNENLDSIKIIDTETLTSVLDNLRDNTFDEPILDIDDDEFQ